ncbi:MoaD/ThiS family protein [Glycomyces sp. L485]|uniref:MoaD/ThiS family protein n=1 Tax=Glycomyces sp. L485 TaxID=2909235 RepID=UPI001F4A5529|nr:MoaD/ThiS family protein [Glycomyces sp. L485]MCH7231493.1 MoaD/ThiS family protein [Glycomyces sp. L485]
MMDIDVKIPAALASECGGARRISVAVDDGADLAGLLDRIEADHPRLGRRLRDEAGNVRRFVNVYIGDEECRRLKGLETALAPGQTVQILPSIAGGA